MPDPNPTEIAKQAQLVNLAQVGLALNGNNILGREAQQIFGTLQQVCALILLDRLRDYEYTHLVDTPPEPKKKKVLDADAG